MFGAGAARGVSIRVTAIGAGAGAGVGAGRCESCGIAALDEEVTSPSTSPRVITVNSARMPSNSYASCIGLQGTVYRAVTVALAVSACATTALKSFRLMAMCIFSSMRNSSKSFLSQATDVWTGYLRISGHV